MNYKIKTNGVEYEVHIHKIEGNIAHLTVNDVDFEVEVEGMTMKNPTRMGNVATVKTVQPDTNVVIPKSPKDASEMRSPLPGTILEICVAQGDTIKKGQILVILEAMKMENSIQAEQEGVVEKINISKGDSVLEGDVLLIIK